MGALLLGVAVLGGCTRPQETEQEQVKREAAQDAKEVRQDLRQAGAEAQKAAEKLRTETKAAVEGAREGWKQGDTGKGSGDRVDVNSASPAELEALPGISPAAAHRIVRGRPYDDPEDLLTRGIVGGAEYGRLRDRITAK